MSTSNAAPVQSPEGHDAAMVTAYNDAQARATGEAPSSTQAAPNGSNERPSWLPEKFQSPEALADAYKQLEAKLSKGQPQTTQQAPAPSQTEAQEQLSAAGLDYSSFEQEWVNNGQLSDATYQKLEAAGIPRNVVDSYISGQEALAANLQSEVFGVVGGQDKYTEMVTWASKNLTPSQIEAYDRAVSSNDRDAIFLAVEGLKARFSAAGGIEPNLINGSGSSESGSTFRSTAELTEAMRDPRYAKDPAYRSEVMERLKRSQVF